MILRVPVKIVREGAELPQRAYEHDAAFDLCSAVDVTLRPQERATVPTGIALGLPAHVAGLTVPRSGLAARHGITIVNAPGLIDPGYRGEVHVVLLNTDREQAFEIRRGDRARLRRGAAGLRTRRSGLRFLGRQYGHEQ